MPVGFAREYCAPRRGSFGHQSGTKMGPRAWNGPPRADQLTPLTPLISLARTTPGNTACAGPVVAIQSFFCHSRPCSSRSDLVRQDTKMWIIFEVPHLQGPSDQLCTPLVTGVAVVMPQRHYWLLVMPKLDIFCVSLT